MQKRFIELVSHFLSEAHIDCIVAPGDHVISVPVGDFRFNIGLFESMRTIVLQGIVGIVPGTGREALYAELLRMNSLFKGTHGATLGLEGDAVTLQYGIPIDGVDDASFAAQAATFLEAIAAMLEGFDSLVAHVRSVPDATATAEDATCMGKDVIRV